MTKLKISITTDDGEIIEMFTVLSEQADINAAAYEMRDLIERKAETVDGDGGGGC